jgi:DNA-binding PadR family transcriptional regulator
LTSTLQRDILYYDRYTTTVVVFEGGGEAMISSDVIRGYNDTMILFLLLEEPSYGYEISRKIREISEGRYVIKETTLYSAFSRLEKNGYIESFYRDETTEKKRTYYRITQDGLEYYREKCEEWYLTRSVIDLFVRDRKED